MGTTTEAATMNEHRRVVREAILDRLLHDLRDYMRAYPLAQSENMPEHDLVWATGVNGGPEALILKTIAANPALWAETLPETVCIVPKNALKKAGLADDLINHFAAMGGQLVYEHAARFPDRPHSPKTVSG